MFNPGKRESDISALKGAFLKGLADIYTTTKKKHCEIANTCTCAKLAYLEWSPYKRHEYFTNMKKKLWYLFIFIFDLCIAYVYVTLHYFLHIFICI